MILFADEVIFRFRLDMTTETIATETIDDIHEAPVAYAAAPGGHIELEKLPIPRRCIPARFVLDHDFRRDELHDRPWRVNTSIGGFRNSQRCFEITQQVINVEMTNCRHFIQAAE